MEQLIIEDFETSNNSNQEISDANVKSTHQDEGYVSNVYKCETKNAKKLCIYDISSKIVTEDYYDIGGTYKGDESDLWFYYTTTVCPKQLYMINVFVCCKSPEAFTIGISNSNDIKYTKNGDNKYAILSNDLKCHSFISGQGNEKHYIKTFCFKQTDVDKLHSNILCIPISISGLKISLDDDIIKSIKIQHDFGGLLRKQDTTDFVIVSANQNKFPVHKLILAAHSPVLRTLIKVDSNSLFIDLNDDDLTLFVEYLYTGAIVDIHKQDCQKLLKLAEKFDIKSLFHLTQYILGNQIKIENAVELAITAKKFKLKELSEKVFNFIKLNPEITKTKGWMELDDVELAKDLFKHIHGKNSYQN